MKNVDNMSNTKPLGKMTKAELLELAKENKDDIRTMDFKLSELYAENESLKVRLEKAIDNARLLRDEAKINQKMLNRYEVQKRLSGQVVVGSYKIPKEPWYKRLNNWFSNLFSKS